ncbi:hypothetical protein FACS1894208_01360 [Clostridia bacterium]|nr:hypothetical protein FACS1894208_01360 [Clostridia bacterium]
MTRKRFTKLVMSWGIQRNTAHKCATAWKCFFPQGSYTEMYKGFALARSQFPSKDKREG